ncbi:protein of unknown function [Micropruina glycogenica]|uniref:Uncharacterized protein n=1 Tax=Micropruina glycogenica TaxID=75385 RepID=A0A2N9JCW7_9ACTN|nr:protein of unknown function [Micropruina glycogenica]
MGDCLSVTNVIDRGATAWGAAWVQIIWGGVIDALSDLRRLSIGRSLQRVNRVREW